MGTVRFYLTDASVLEKYPFEKDGDRENFVVLYNCWRMLTVDLRTLQVRINPKNETISLLCEMYKNGEIIITDRKRYTEIEKEKAREKLDKAIEKLKQEFEDKYGQYWVSKRANKTYKCYH